MTVPIEARMHITILTHLTTHGDDVCEYGTSFK